MFVDYCLDHKAIVKEPWKHLKEFPVHDVRSFHFGALLQKYSREKFTFKRRNTGPLPATIDLRPMMYSGNFRTLNQGNQGSCTAHCGVEDRALMEIKRGDYPGEFSPAFLYYQERVILGTTDQDSGANMENIGQVLTQWGVCLNSQMTYSDANYTTAPTSADFSAALSWVCGTQTAIDPADIQAAVYDCSVTPSLGSVRIGVPVFESFMDAVTNGGWVTVPSVTEGLLGGHAMEVVGYAMMQSPSDKAPQLYIIVLQSWGDGVGDESTGLSSMFIPLAYFTCAAVMAQGGTDNWQQVNQSVTPIPPGTLSLNSAPATIVNNGSTQETANINGLNVGDTFEIDVTDPNNNVIAVLGTGTASSTTDSITNGVVTTYTGPASITAYDHTSNIKSNSVPVTIVAPSVCPVGNSVAALAFVIPLSLAGLSTRAMNIIPTVLGRQGRFYAIDRIRYVVP